LWNPFNPQSALTGCNSDRGVGLMEKPDPQVDEGRKVACKGPGRRSRKAALITSPKQEGKPAGDERKVSCPAAARKGCGGVRSSPEAGHCLVKGAGRFAENGGASCPDGESGGTGKALRRFGGRSVLPPGKRKQSWEVSSRSRSKILARSMGCCTTVPG
jgi:hypothetical protein